MSAVMASLFEDDGAIFSPCRSWRYLLWRIWDPEKPLATFILLNPSVAGESAPDPTVTRCIRRMMLRGYGGILIVNLFGWVDSNPAALLTALDPVGEDNDVHLMRAARRADIVICGWGTKFPRGSSRHRAVLQMLREAGITPMCLVKTKEGHPKHPLYVGYEVEPIALLDIAA